MSIYSDKLTQVQVVINYQYWRSAFKTWTSNIIEWMLSLWVYFLVQYSLLLQYGILEKLVTFITEQTLRLTFRGSRQIGFLYHKIAQYFLQKMFLSIIFCIEISIILLHFTKKMFNTVKKLKFVFQKLCITPRGTSNFQITRRLSSPEPWLGNTDPGNNF